MNHFSTVPVYLVTYKFAVLYCQKVCYLIKVNTVVVVLKETNSIFLPFNVSKILCRTFFMPYPYNKPSCFLTLDSLHTVSGIGFTDEFINKSFT